MMSRAAMLFSFLVVALTVALLTNTAEGSPVRNPYGYPPMPYDYRYGVLDQYSGSDFGHEETSNGKAVTGRYYVLLPDGRRQVVSYVADHHRGYMATISYENVGFNPKAPVNRYRYG